MGDDRIAFDCGRNTLNGWFGRHAWRNQLSGAPRTSVLVDPSAGQVMAYVSIAMAQIARDHLPKAAQRNQPDPLPAMLLGLLAVDLRHQGPGHARTLMAFGLRTALRLSKEVGCFGVLTHPLDDDLRGFYRRFGFGDLPGDPSGMLVRVIDLELSGL